MSFRLLPRSFSFAVASLLLLLSDCHRGEVLLPDRPRSASGVAMQDVTFHSAALGRDMPYRVYVPMTIEAGRKLPVVYLLHGSGGSYQNWSNYSDVARYAAQGVILVMVEGGSSYFMNAVERPQDKYEDYLVHDLVQDVEARFAARTDRAGRAIVGVSMGGFAAVKLALSHPEMFVFAGAISPAIDVPERRFTWKRFWQWQRFRDIFGPWGSAERAARDPFVLARSADGRSLPYLYVTAGEQEALLAPNLRFVTLLKSRGIAYEFHTKPGGHDWGEWNTQIPGCFEALLQRLGH